MSEMSLDEQIHCMKQVRSDLEDFCKDMLGFMDDLQKDIIFLRSQGFSTETEETYQKGYYAPANDMVEEVVGDVRVKHFDYIDRVIERLERAKNRR